MRPKAKRAEAIYLVKKHEVSRRHVCRLLGLHRSSFDYPEHPRSDEPVASKLLEFAAVHRRFGHPRLLVLLKREGIAVNHKRSERIYQKLKLQVKVRKRKKLGSVPRIPIRQATGPNQVWAIDFVHDYIESGRKLKLLTIVDEFSKISPSILVDLSITGKNVCSFLNTIASPLPETIRVDQGTEFTSRAFLDWAYTHGVELQFTRVRKPNQVVESFNSRVRDEVLNEHVFHSLEDAREKIDRWHWKYNHFNPHSSLGMKTPAEFAKEQETMLSA